MRISVKSNSRSSSRHIPISRTPRADMASTFESLRARYFAPSAVMAPVRMSVIAVASRIAFGMPVAGSNRLRIAISDGNLISKFVDEIADHLDAGETQRLHHAAQHVEVADRGALRNEMHPRLDHGLAGAPGRASRPRRVQDLVVGQRQRVDIRAVEIGDGNRSGALAQGAITSARACLPAAPTRRTAWASGASVPALLPSGWCLPYAPSSRPWRRCRSRYGC